VKTDEPCNDFEKWQIIGLDTDFRPLVRFGKKPLGNGILY
jgi:hypothetical protein